VAVCTGGYTGQGLTPLLRNKIMPVLSNSVVTRPLTSAEIAATNFRSRTFLTDTRTLRFYYRLLPDNRLQIGSRSSITGADADRATHLRLLTDAIARKFPPLAGIQIDYSWWGWVDVSHDMMPRITRPDPGQTVWHAVGYGGNGVSFSTWAGKRLAERVAGQDAGQEVFRLPIYDSPLEHPNLFWRRFAGSDSACSTSGTGCATRSRVWPQPNAVRVPCPVYRPCPNLGKTRGCWHYRSRGSGTLDRCSSGATVVYACFLLL
jgi:glycine/D-amino acid oxidase-like deaminating enzyme